MQDPKKPSHRIEKVNALLQQLVGEAIQEYTNNGPALVTVNRVETSRDMKWAKVWISIVSGNGDSEVETKIMANLHHHLYDIQGEVNRAMETKIVPRLQLFLDTAPRYAQHLNEVIEHLHDDESSIETPHS